MKPKRCYVYPYLITLDENAISLHALFRQTLTIPWNEIRHAGFASSSTELLLFDWIYLGHEPMPLAYQHQCTACAAHPPLSASNIGRISFSLSSPA